jgi:hypothetical protein
MATARAAAVRQSETHRSSTGGLADPKYPRMPRSRGSRCLDYWRPGEHGMRTATTSREGALDERANTGFIGITIACV